MLDKFLFYYERMLYHVDMIPVYLSTYKRYFSSTRKVSGGEMENMLKSINGLGSSAYSMYLKLAIYISAVCLIGSGIAFLTKSKDPRQLGVVKRGVVLRIILTIMVFSGVALISLILKASSIL